MNQITPLSALLNILWRSKFLLLTGTIIGIAIGSLLVIRPGDPPLYSKTLDLDVGARYSDADPFYNDFLALWRHTPLWSPQPDLTPFVAYDPQARAAEIRLTSPNGDGKAFARYEEGLKALIDQYKESKRETLQASMEQLKNIANEFPNAGDDYAVEYTHKARLALLDLPHLFQVSERPEEKNPVPATRSLLTIGIAAFIGLVTAILAALAASIWRSAGNYRKRES